MHWREAARTTLRSDVAIVAALLVLTLGSCLLAMRWGLPDGASPETTGTWAIDTIAPIGPLNEAYHRFTREGVDDVIYPLFHYFVLAGAYAPYVAVAMLTGDLQSPTASFPYGATDPESFFTHLTLIAGLVSALMATGIVFIVYLLTRDLFDRRAARWAAMFAALVPPLHFYGMTSNLDVPYLFWTMLSVWQLVRAAIHQRLRNYVLCGVFAGFAVATKDPALGFFLSWPVIVPLLIVWGHRRAGQLHQPLSLLTDLRMWGAVFGLLTAFALGNNLVFGGMGGFVRHLQFADSLYQHNVATDTAGLFARQPGLLADSVLLMAQMVGPLLLVLAIAGIVTVGKQRRHVALLLPLAAVSYYVSIVAPTLSLSRYLIGVVLLLTPFAGFAIVTAHEAKRGSWSVLAKATAVLAIAWQLLLLLNLHATLWRDSRHAMESWVRANVPEGATIEAYTQARYLPRLSDRYHYNVVANSFSAVSYDLVGKELSVEALAGRMPDYVMILEDSGLSGDPQRLSKGSSGSTSAQSAIVHYFEELMGQRAGYALVARYETPTWLPWRQVTAGTQPTTLLYARQTGD